MKKISVILFSVVCLLICYSSTYAQPDVLQNRYNLEASIRVNLSDHYLYLTSYLMENTWIEVKMSTEVWKNPNDTREFIDRVFSLAKRNLPLTAFREFRVIIEEPYSKLQIAVVRSSGLSVECDYLYYVNRKSKLVNPENENFDCLDLSKFIRPDSLYSGLRLYSCMGDALRFEGCIICFSKDGRVKVMKLNRKTEWIKKEDILAVEGKWHIDKNDPALKAMEYYEFD